MRCLPLILWSILLTIISARYYHRLRHIRLEESFCTGYQELKDNKCAARLSSCSKLSPKDLRTMRQVLCGFKFDPDVQTDPPTTEAKPPFVPFVHHKHHFKDVFEAPIHSYRFLASIYSSDRKYLCSGALISPKTVVTSAQCVAQSVKRKKRQDGEEEGQTSDGEVPASDGKLVVRFGEQHLNINPVYKNVYEYDVESIEVNDKYDESTHENDIAIIRLVNPVPICKFPPIYIPRKFEYWLDFHHLSGCSATYLGWGLKNQRPYLRALTGKVLPQHFCTKQFNWDHNQLHASHLCVESHSGVCVSDIGGPLITYAKDHWVLVGLMTFGKHCRTPGLPLIFTRITEVLPEIHKYVEQDFNSRNISLQHEECHPIYPFYGHIHPLKPHGPIHHEIPPHHPVIEDIHHPVVEDIHHHHDIKVIPLGHGQHDGALPPLTPDFADIHKTEGDHHLTKELDLINGAAVPHKHLDYDYLK